VPVLDVGSAVVTPGLIIAHTDLGWGREIDEPVDADASYLRAVDVFDPNDRRIDEAVRAGFLGLVYSPGSANVLAGSMGLVRPGAAKPIHTEFLAAKFVLTADSRNNERYPASLAGQHELLDQALSLRSLERQLFVPELIQDQLDQERRRQMEALLSRQRVAVFAARTEAEIGTALSLIERFRLRGVLAGPEQFEPFLADIKRLGVGIVARPIRADDYDRYVQSIVKAAGDGIPLAFGLGTAEQIRVTAALAVNAGLPRSTCLSALTRGAATMLGMPAGAGRLIVGQPADLVIWNDSPLDPAASPLQVMIDGKPWDNRTTLPAH
jgi:imidazolonepropionase-like amidohydrolase